MKKMIVSGLGCLVILLAIGSAARAHCEIPCGIYGDEMRVQMIAEHISTIEKSMKLVNELSAAEKPNYNQLVRWVDNKEQHADEIQHIVTQYFMTQRIKPADPSDKEAQAAYEKELTLLHKMLIQAMKAKQGTDQAVVDELRKLLDEFSEAYLGHKVN
jgi:nickel superoxide dismutase